MKQHRAGIVAEGYQPAASYRPIFLVVLFLVSGGCGLVYEVLWVRQFSLIFGVTVHAIATVLSAFMAGLALGSFLVGRFADRIAQPLKLYALLELGIGASALLLSLLLPALPGLYARLWGTLGRSAAAFASVRFLLCFALLMAPTTLMGGTLPVLSRWFLRKPGDAGRQTGLLYALNTLGATAGVLFAGFAAIRILGISLTAISAAALNLLVAAAVLWIGRGEPGSAPIAHGVAAPARTPLERGARLAMLAFGCSGFCSLAYEVLWTRALVFYLHNSTYAFSAMLMTFLLGIALGSFAVHRLVDRMARPLAWLGATQVLIGVATVGSLLLYRQLPAFTAAATNLVTIDAWWKAIALLFAQAFLILLPPTLLMGATFPIASRICLERETAIGRSLGLLYAANTVGSILGSLAAGFVLISWLGVRDSFLLLVVINGLMGAWLIADERTLALGTRALGPLAIAAVLMVAPLVVDKLIMFESYQGKERQNIVFYKEGATDTVFVTQLGANIATRVIRYADGRGTAGIGTNFDNRYDGHLPMLLHENPRRVLCICFGVGNTAAAIATHPIEALDIVELSANAFAAADCFPTNDGVLRDPRVNPIVQDGRNFLLVEDQRYDVISLDPPEMHTDGVVNLYTREFYQLAKRRLNPGGILSTWINVSMMPHAALRMLLKTFQDVFPHAAVWTCHEDGKYFVFTGTDGPLRIDMMNFSRRFYSGKVYQDMQKLEIASPHQFLATFLMGEASLRKYCGDAPVLCDDHSRVDFTVPMSVDANYGLTNAFSGHFVAVSLPGGREAVAKYYVERARLRMGVHDDVRDYLENFLGGEHERLDLEAALRAVTGARERWLNDAPRLFRQDRWANF
ncbi:MAG: fused MFS/spermidine synthase [Planctomycetota bacterium]